MACNHRGHQVYQITFCARKLQQKPGTAAKAVLGRWAACNSEGNGLEPFAYLTHVFDVMSQTEGITDEQIDSLLPWSDEIPENCREGQHQ